MPLHRVTNSHVGYTYPVNMFEVNKRVRPVLDVDVRGGAGIKYGRNLVLGGLTRQAEPNWSHSWCWLVL